MIEKFEFCGQYPNYSSYFTKSNEIGVESAYSLHKGGTQQSCNRCRRCRRRRSIFPILSFPGRSVAVGSFNFPRFGRKFPTLKIAFHSPLPPSLSVQSGSHSIPSIARRTNNERAKPVHVPLTAEEMLFRFYLKVDDMTQSCSPLAQVNQFPTWN